VANIVSLCPFLPMVLYSKEQKERVKRIEVFPSNPISQSLIVFPLSFASSNIARMDWTYCGRQQETHTQPHEIRGMKKEIPSKVNREVA
jgi:hypothetical protein